MRMPHIRVKKLNVNVVRKSIMMLEFTLYLVSRQ
jgi:hypothetical protein